MKLFRDTLRSEMYFKTDIRTSAQLCLATPGLGLSVSMTGLSGIVLQAETQLNLELERELHINSQVFSGRGGIRDSITFLQRGQYYNCADVECLPFEAEEEKAPASSRFEVSCAGDIIQISSSFVFRQNTPVAVAVMRLRGGCPVCEDQDVFLSAGGERIYVGTAQGGLLEVNGDELIVKQPVMSAADGESCSVVMRFCREKSRLFCSPPLGMCVEARSAGNTVQSELDRVHGIYLLDDGYGKDESVDIILENPFDEPVCMPFMLSRKSSSPLGAVLLQDGEQTGVPVQICCERIMRGGTGVSYYDFTVAPLLGPGQRICLTLELTGLTGACHLWTHGSEAQCGRVELCASGGCCVLDPARSCLGDSVPWMISFADRCKRKYSADILNISDASGRLEMHRIRLTDLFCGPLEAGAVHEAYTPDRALRITLRQSMLISRDYTRLNVSVEAEALASARYERFELVRIKGDGLYFGDDVSVSYAEPARGNGLRCVRELGENEFTGFDGIGVCIRRLCGGRVLAEVFAREGGGERWLEAVLRLAEADFSAGDIFECDFTLALVPDAENYCGRDRELADSLELIKCAQLMRREAAVNRVENIAVQGSGTSEIRVAESGVAEVIQSGGIGVVPVRFCGISRPEGCKVLSGGEELPLQLEMDRRGEYHILAACIAPDNNSERRYKLVPGDSGGV